MYTVDDANSDKHGHDYSAVRRPNKHEAVVNVNPPEIRSNDALRMMLRYKLSALPLPEVGFDRKVSAGDGDEERISATKETLKNIVSIRTPPISKCDQKTACNSPPKCEKKSVRIQRICENSKREKFSVSLSRREIEQDFMAITGKKLPGKPKKRPRVVQNQINVIFPGQSLTEVHVNKYRVKGNGKLNYEL